MTSPEPAEPGRCVDADLYRFSDCAGEVTYGPDPAAWELYDDDTPVWMCEEHRYQSAMDV